MAECEVEIKQWGSHTLYACARCNVRTLDEAVLRGRCELRQQQPLVSATGLLGPKGEPLSKPESAPEPTSHDELEHVGGGWYELADGTRVQGHDKAVEAQETHDQ